MNLTEIDLRELGKIKKQNLRETGFSGQECGMAEKDK